MPDFRVVWGWTRPGLALLTGILIGSTPCWQAVVVAGAGVGILAMAGTFRPAGLLRDILSLTAAAALVLPPQIASGAGVVPAIPALVAWWLTFLVGTLVVHAVKRRLEVPVWQVSSGGAVRPTSGGLRWAAPAVSAGVLLAALMGALGAGGSPGWAGPAAALVLPSAAGLALSIPRVHPRYLHRIGWTLVVVEALTLVLLVQGG